jgi:hypothetical protein
MQLAQDRGIETVEGCTLVMLSIGAYWGNIRTITGDWFDFWRFNGLIRLTTNALKAI